MKITKDNEEIKYIMKELFDEDTILECERLGGLTNRTYKVTAGHNHKQYAVRLPGKGTSKLIRRQEEYISTRLACSIGIDAKLFYFDETTGVKVSEYIANSVTMHPEDMRQKANLILAAEVLKKLHTCNENTHIEFNVIEMAEYYERYVLENRGSLYEDYQEIKTFIINISAQYLPKVQKTPCHNDPLCENWILQGNDKMFLIDWEYAGMNDPMWDLADVSIEAGLSTRLEGIFLQEYLQREANEEEWRALQINKVLIDYLWSLWGKTRAVHEGAIMEEYALDRYLRMKENLGKVQER